MKPSRLGSKKRLFFGIPLEGAPRDEVTARILPLKKAFPRARWVRPEKLHFTVRFLGSVPEEAVEEIVAWAEARVESARLGRIALGPPGTFGGRVLWFSAREADWMTALAEALSGEVAGLPAEVRPFRPHLTVARLDARRFPDRGEGLLARFLDLPPPASVQETTRLVLFESRKNRDGDYFFVPLATLRT